MLSESYNKGLKKTQASFTNRLWSLFSGSRAQFSSLAQEVEEIMLSTDLGVAITQEIMEKLSDGLKNQVVDDIQQIFSVLKKDLVEALAISGSKNLVPPEKKPTVYLILGVNGSGKTTAIGKLASHFTKQGKKVLLAAADTFRAAAIEQLEIWAQQSGSDLVKHQPGSDPAAVVYDAYSAAKARGIDALIIDTAGRLHTKFNLVEELKKIKRVLQKNDPSVPHETLLVMDATTGQNGLSQCRIFHTQMELTGIILTKLDGTAKGGIVFAIQKEFGVPVKLIGTGEGINDLEVFDENKFVEALLQKPYTEMHTVFDELQEKEQQLKQKQLPEEEVKIVHKRPKKKKLPRIAIFVAIVISVVFVGLVCAYLCYHNWLENKFLKADYFFQKAQYHKALEIYTDMENKPFLKKKQNQILYERMFKIQELLEQK
ncbi:MAG: signal recognition particle-docking protein FtsY [Elusimicrobiota bacterium]